MINTAANLTQKKFHKIHREKTPNFRKTFLCFCKEWIKKVNKLQQHSSGTMYRTLKTTADNNMAATPPILEDHSQHGRYCSCQGGPQSTAWQLLFRSLRTTVNNTADTVPERRTQSTAWQLLYRSLRTTVNRGMASALPVIGNHSQQDGSYSIGP